MNGDAITAKILEDARNLAEETLKKAQAKAEEEQQKTQQDLDNRRDQAMENAAREAQELHERMLRVAGLDERKKDLAMKRVVIDEAFESALQKMCCMDKKTADAYHIRLLLEAAQGDEEILFNPKDAVVFDETFLASANEALQKAGRKGNLTLSHEGRNIKGGYMLRKNGLEINCSYEAVLREARPTLEAAVADALFQ